MGNYKTLIAIREIIRERLFNAANNIEPNYTFVNHELSTWVELNVMYISAKSLFQLNFCIPPSINQFELKEYFS